MQTSEVCSAIALAGWVEMPPLKSLDDLNQYPDFVERFSRNSQDNGGECDRLT